MFSSVLFVTWFVIQVFIIINVALPLFLYVVQSIRRLTKKPLPADEELYEEKDYAVIVYGNETGDWQALLSSLTQLNYTNYLVYVVIDTNRIKELNITDEKVVILRPLAAMHSRLRMHRFVVENFRRPHTHVAILDCNSLVDKDYLNNLSGCFHQGYQVVQSKIMVKNSSDIYDLVQATGNSYHDFFRNQLSFAAGASAMLAHSGAAITVRLYKQCLRKMTSLDTTDFITNLQSLAVESGHQIAFTPHAVVFDNRKAGMTLLMQQHANRTNRWRRRFAFHFSIMLKGIIGGNLNWFLSGGLLLQLPLFTSFVATVFCVAINAIISPVMAMIWTGCLLLFPAYLVTAALQSTARHIPIETEVFEADENDSQPTLVLYKEDTDEYDMAAQMI